MFLSILYNPACSTTVYSPWQKWGHKAVAERWGNAVELMIYREQSLGRAAYCTGFTSYQLEQQMENYKEDLCSACGLGN